MGKTAPCFTAAWWALFCAGLLTAGDLTVDRSIWKSGGPRAEMLPQFAWQPTGGPQGNPALRIQADSREGLHGWWTAELPVRGGQAYSFSALLRAEGVDLPRRTAVARLFWLNEKGQPPLHDEPVYSSYRPGERPRAEPEYAQLRDDHGDWITVAGDYRAPAEAVAARIELSYRWQANAEICWAGVTLQEIDEIPARRVRLATVHFAPRAGTQPEEKCRQFVPLIRAAAKQRADLVVLPETLTYYGSGRTMAECAEPVPGPSTEFFGALSSELGLYIVAGLLERVGDQVFNVAVLIGPGGKVEGTYRKTCLPRGEIDAGIMPGADYPVFQTRFGTVGMMVCYDGFFPEVARRLSNAGAEVIAFPVWGCNPLLAAARACENHVYVVSSTYTSADADWMITGIFDRDGKVLARADDWGQVIVQEVDLNRRTIWHSLGDFRAENAAHRPLSFDGVTSDGR